MFDYGPPRTIEPDPKGRRKGVGQHPHRGFETVTIGETESNIIIIINIIINTISLAGRSRA